MGPYAHAGIHITLISPHRREELGGLLSGHAAEYGQDLQPEYGHAVLGPRRAAPAPSTTALLEHGREHENSVRGM